jgi:hypothetical protein
MPAEGLDACPTRRCSANEEFLDLIKLFVSMGVRKIRFTGGEPLVRKGFLDIVEERGASLPMWNWLSPPMGDPWRIYRRPPPPRRQENQHQP